MKDTITELKKLPPKPSEESTRIWLDGMDKCWQEFLKLHAAGHLPHISDEDIQKFTAGDDSVLDRLKKSL